MYKIQLCLIGDRTKHRKDPGFAKNMGKYIAHGKQKTTLTCFACILKTCLP